MKLTLLLALIGALALGTSTSSLADDREQDRRAGTGAGFDRGMQAVPTIAGPGQPGHGWRYFCDPAAGRAVVISPQGEYYLNRGEGLSLVAVTQPHVNAR